MQYTKTNVLAGANQIFALARNVPMERKSDFIYISTPTVVPSERFVGNNKLTG